MTYRERPLPICDPTISSKYDLKRSFKVINGFIACTQMNYASFHHFITLMHLCINQKEKLRYSYTGRPIWEILTDFPTDMNFYDIFVHGYSALDADSLWVGPSSTLVLLCFAFIGSSNPHLRPCGSQIWKIKLHYKHIAVLSSALH